MATKYGVTISNDIIAGRKYRLYNTKYDKIYIGSTTETLMDRMKKIDMK